MAKEKLEKCDCHTKGNYSIEHHYVTPQGEEGVYVEHPPDNPMPISAYKGRIDGVPQYWMIFPDGKSGWKVFKKPEKTS